MSRKPNFDPPDEDGGPEGEEDLTLMLLTQPFKDPTQMLSEIVTKNEGVKPLEMMVAAVDSIKPRSISLL